MSRIPVFLILDMQEIGNFVFISRSTGKCETQEANFCIFSLWTCSHHIAILKSEKKYIFFMILAWLCRMRAYIYGLTTLEQYIIAQWHVVNMRDITALTLVYIQSTSHMPVIRRCSPGSVIEPCLQLDGQKFFLLMWVTKVLTFNNHRGLFWQTWLLAGRRDFSKWPPRP